jgi:hypothetical protein
MRRSIVILWSITTAAGAGVLISTGTRAAESHLVARNARRDLAHVTQQATHLVSLRRAAPEVPERQESGLAPRVAGAMSAAGLATSVLQSLSPDSRSGEPGARVSRQRATLSLSGLSLPQVGKFLDAWRTAEPHWIVSSIELSPIAASNGLPSALGTDLPLRAVVTIEGLFKEPASRPGASR